jgi:TetR/AcrR family transcriptional repressor of lmrAB and yxaGH operons
MPYYTYRPVTILSRKDDDSMKCKTESREKILTAAAMLFQIKGFNATGLNEILSESGSPKGSLYYYFPNGKEELALEAIQLSSKSIQKRLNASLNKYASPIEAIQFTIKNIAEDMEKANKLKDISISLIALETYFSSEPLREACKEVFEILENMYSKKLIESGIPKKIALELGMLIQVMIEGAITVSLTQRNVTALLVVSKHVDILLSPYIQSK